MYLKTKNNRNLISTKAIEKWTITKIVKGCSVYMDVLTTNLNGVFFATGSVKGKVHLWNTSYFKNLSTIDTCLSKISTIIFDINSNHIFTGGNECMFDEWDFSKSILIRKYTGHSNGITKLARNFCLNLLISSSRDGTLKLWDSRVYKNILTLHTHEENVSSFSNHDQSPHIVSANSNGNIWLWDLKMNKNTYIIKNSIREINNIYQLINKKYLLAINKKSIIIHEKNNKIIKKIINKKYTNTCSVCIKDYLVISCLDGQIKIINFHKKNNLLFIIPSTDNVLYKNKITNLAMEFNKKKNQLLLTDMEKNIKIIEKKWTFV